MKEVSQFTSSMGTSWRNAAAPPGPKHACATLGNYVLGLFIY